MIPLRQWVVDVLRLCQERGPQTSHEILAYLVQREAELHASESGPGWRYLGASRDPGSILSRLRARRDIRVEVVGTKQITHPNGGTRLRDLYMIAQDPT